MSAKPSAEGLGLAAAKALKLRAKAQFALFWGFVRLGVLGVGFREV